MALLRFGLACLFVCLALPAPAQETAPGARLAEAFAALRSGDWDRALEQGRASGTVGHDVILWHWLRAGRGDFEDYADFLARNPDWPGLPLMRRRGEPSLPDTAAPEAVMRHFDGAPPQTGAGLAAYARAALALGREGDAVAELVRGWRSLGMTEGQERALLEAHGEILAPHHTARLDEMLWRGNATEARRAMARVDEGWRKLAEARLALRAQEPGVDARIAAVPERLADDPGMAFERFNWRARKGRNADALELLLARSGSAESLGQPERWASWRRILARWALRNGDAATAYRAAAQHHLLEGSSFADLEWLAGFIALRELDDPAGALVHFERFETAVVTPISLGRAGYWRGRALEAMGETDRAQAAYIEGSRHQTSFYGLLAAERAGLPLDPALAGTETFADWRMADFMGTTVLKAGLLLLDAGERYLAERFLVHLAERLDRAALGQLADMALDLDAPHIALRIAKQGASRGVVIERAYFPVPDELLRLSGAVPPDLVLAIARRESEFDATVRSPAGALGLMQLMPGTASDMASATGVAYDRGRLTADPAYNARLGVAYLEGLIERFDGNIVMVSAGYNAGPGRPIRWMEAYGDPRRGGVDVIDWIENIPFRETRNYVMRVAESMLVYRARLGAPSGPVRLSEELVD